MSVRDSVGGACLDAIAAKDATRIVDVVNAGVALARGDALRLSIFGGLDVDAAGGARRRTQEATHTLFQAVFVPVQNVNPAVAGLEMDRLFGIIFSNGFPQHGAESYAETFYQCGDCFAGFSQHGGHRVSV